MKIKLNCILLVDDDEATNFFNNIIIKKANCTHHIQTTQTGQEALNYLTNSEKFEGRGTDYPRPDLIFLDLNMPGMNGWEFLNKYKDLEEGQKGKIVLVMLTTSPNPDDELKARTIEEVSGFKNKPLTGKMLEELLLFFFPEHF